MKTLHRFRFVLLAVTGVLLVAATVYTMRNGPSTDEAAGHLGPTTSAEEHIRTQKAYLDRISAQRPTQEASALVSLEDYVPAEKAEALARSLDATWVFVRFPAAEHEPPSAVATSISNTLEKRVSDLRRDISAEVSALKAQAADASGSRKTDLDELIAKREGELAKLTPNCACVFAFAIEGASLRQLRELADRPEVKLVDVPEPVTADLGGWELQPLVPSSDAA